MVGRYPNKQKIILGSSSSIHEISPQHNTVSITTSISYSRSAIHDETNIETQYFREKKSKAFKNDINTTAPVRRLPVRKQ